MTVRIEMARAADVSVGLALPNTHFGLDTIADHALVINADSAVVIEGTLDELRFFVAQLAMAVNGWEVIRP